MRVNLSSGNYEIVAHGTTFLFGPDEDLKINVSEGDFDFSICLRFLQDETGKQEVKQRILGNKVELSCFNFQDQGTGTVSPAEIAKIKGRRLCLMFWSFIDGNGVRSVRYTLFYERKGVDER